MQPPASNFGTLPDSWWTQLVRSVGHRSAGRTVWPLLIWGVIGILASLAIFTRPLYLPAFTLTSVAGVWALIFGVLEVVLAFQIKGLRDWPSMRATA